MQHHNRQKSSTFSRDKEVRKIYTFTIPRENFDELNPDKQVIRQLISKHISMVGRLQKNMRYYGGDHEILKEKRKNKLVCNHAKDISDTASSYFIGIRMCRSCMTHTATVIGGRNGLNVRAKIPMGSSEGFTDNEISKIVNNDTCAIAASIKIDF